jgi:AraC-like DNA-binding protein
VRSLQGPFGSIYIDTSGSDAAFVMETNLDQENIQTFTYDMYSLFSYYKLFSWLISESLAPKKITIAHQQFAEDFVIEELIDCQVEFGAKRNSIVFKKDLLARPIVRSPQELRRLMGARMFEFLAPLPTTRISVRLERLLKKMLEENSGISTSDQIASQMGKSGQTLRRHLAQENTSFQNILDKCRIEKAKLLLNTTDATIENISEILGFSASSGFSRAFKHWTGHAPSYYRQLPPDARAALTNDTASIYFEEDSDADRSVA